ncbi:hypothetical protein N8726_04480 [Pelagibacteraceae bacterium]|nr:hypothetical protein [Pelagibacteraceae bacterium]
MKKVLVLIFFYLICSHSITAQERSEKEIKAGVFLEDLESIGNFKKIEKAPVELFDKKHKSFTSRSSYALTEIGRLFVQQKGLLEKYPARMMKGMVYFEFFYQQQLKDNERAINNFKANYPPWDPGNIKAMQKLYSLNKARKSMREALGLNLNDDMSKVFSTQVTMYKLLNQSKTSINKLTKEEKKIIKLDKNINKEVGKVKTLVEKRSENRINENKFLKEYSRANKKLINALKKAQYKKEYELLASFVNELDVYKNKDISVILSGLKLTEFILKDLKKNTLKKKFDQDLSKADFSKFTQDELVVLSEITQDSKLKKNIKSNEIQIDILNLENNKLPVSKLLDVFRNELGVELNSINLQLASKEDMDKWVLSDWANAWKSPIPTKKQKNPAGIEISLTKNEIESVKAQLSMQNFKELIDIDQFKDLITNNSNLAELQASVIESTKSFDFSYTLDDWAVDFGNYNGFDLNNYADLTALANAQYGANWSVEEYASAYQETVDIISAIKSGDLSSIDLSAIASGLNVQEAIDLVVNASTAGISVDLEAAAEGLGYDSFADAVAAYNEANGTSYTEAQAREALGQ